jgi:hypothetical protein
MRAKHGRELARVRENPAEEIWSALPIPIAYLAQTALMLNHAPPYSSFRVLHLGSFFTDEYVGGGVLQLVELRIGKSPSYTSSRCRLLFVIVQAL